MITHEAICNELITIYKAKNADYGDSFGESIKEWGMIAAIVRMDDKMRRLKHMVKYPYCAVAESMRDTLLDMANYAIMSIMEIENGGKNE